MSLKNITEQIFQFSRPFFPPGASVVVAVSGGSDSVALLFLLYELKERLSIADPVVAHVNHGLRGAESDEDERLVRSYAEKLGIRCFFHRLQGHAIDEPGLEAWAREERYRFFHEIRNATGSTLIATGHTLDDQAETVLMRIMRGSGLNGLRGIAPLREDGVVRPLLCVRKRELEVWLADRGIGFRVDASNSDLHLLRNRIRQTVIPHLESVQPDAAVHVAALAAEAHEQWTFRQDRVIEWKGRALFAETDASFRLKAEALSESAAASEGVRQLFVTRGITPYRHHIAGVIANANRTGGTFLLPDGWRYRCGGGVLFFFKTLNAFFYRITVPGLCECPDEGRKLSISRTDTLPDCLDQGTWTVFFDGGCIGNECVYRSITPSDAFIPFGADHEVNILKFLSKQGVVRPLRERTGILVASDNKPVWIHGIRLDERVRITKATKSVIKVQSESIL